MIRSTVSALLLAIVLALLSLALWGKSEINSPERFAESSRQALSSPQVQGLLAERITSEVWDRVDTEALIRDLLPGDAEVLSGPADLAARAALSNGISRVLGTEWAQEIWTESVQTTYSNVLRALQNRNSALLIQKQSVYVDLGSAARVAATKIGLPAELTKNIPSGLGQIELARTRDVYKIQRAYQVLQISPLPLLVLALLLAALIVFVQRRQLWRGAAFLAGAFFGGWLLVLLAASIAEPFLLGSLRDPLSSQIAAAVWQDWAQSIRDGAWRMFGIGAALGLLATGLSPYLRSQREGALRRARAALQKKSD